MIWDKPITADGCTATPEQQQAAWKSWIERGNGRTSDLAGFLVNAGAGNSAHRWRCSEVAHRMVQKARKAGVIRFNGRGWELVETRP